MFIRTPGFFAIGAARTLIPTSPEVGSGVSGYFDGPLKARRENGDVSLLTSFQEVGRSSEIQRVCRTLRRLAQSQRDGKKHMRISRFCVTTQVETCTEIHSLYWCVVI